MIDIACAILTRNGEILLARRAGHKRLYPNHWDVVGGHVEAGESVDAGLIREVQEEVGVTPTEFRLLEVITEPGTAGGEGTRYHIYAVTEWSGGDPRMLGDEHTEMRWVTPELAGALTPLALPQYLPIFAAMRLTPGG